MSMALKLAERSIDPRTKVGCLIVSGDNTRVLAVGYNGDQRGGPNRIEDPEPGKSGTIHGELNALIKCDFGFPGQKVMFVTTSPCDDCAKLIINGGISQVVYAQEYRDALGLQRLRAAGITVRQFSP